MRCYICDNELSENEIQLDEENKSEPCTTCLKVIHDTAYCDGFEPSDGDSTTTRSTLLEEISDEG